MVLSASQGNSADLLGKSHVMFNPGEALFRTTEQTFGGRDNVSGEKSKSPKKSPFPRRQAMPTFPNETAKGLLTGQSIKINPKQKNVMAELNLEDHFLKKLEELRVMKEEYY